MNKHAEFIAEAIMLLEESIDLIEESIDKSEGYVYSENSNLYYYHQEPDYPNDPMSLLEKAGDILEDAQMDIFEFLGKDIRKEATSIIHYRLRHQKEFKMGKKLDDVEGYVNGSEYSLEFLEDCLDKYHSL